MQATQQGTGRTAGQAVADRLGEIELGAATTHGQMVVFPIFAPGHAAADALADAAAPALAYRTLQEALADRSVKVTERERAAVPELVIQNTSTMMILILDGEEIIDGRQNRIVNASFLVPAQITMPLPVSCVEHGRWRDVSPVFASGEASNFRLRQAKHAQVTNSLRTTGHYASDQGAIWHSVAQTSAARRVSSPSGAMHDIYRSRQHDLSSYQEAFGYVPGAIGLMVALAGRVAGGDVFDQPRTAQEIWPKLVRSYALDALDGATEPGDPAGPAPANAVDTELVRDLLARARAGRYEVFPSAALGEDVRLEGEGVVGGGLVHQDVSIHINLFRAPDAEPGERYAAGRIARASERREMVQRQANVDPRQHRQD